MDNEHKTSIKWLYKYYWLRANLMRERFFKKNEGYLENNFDQHTYMNFWYAFLYSVVEGYQNLELHNIEVDPLLASSNLEALRKFRHSVTGFHEAYFNINLINPLLSSSTTCMDLPAESRLL